MLARHDCDKHVDRDIELQQASPPPFPIRRILRARYEPRAATGRSSPRYRLGMRTGDSGFSPVIVRALRRLRYRDVRAGPTGAPTPMP